ncbi:MAG: SMU1112c/YaeR family gloxylase I-like metalloprotein [Culicoidibacterales bacterium]
MFLHQIHHIAIIASDYQKSKYFYTQILQLPIIAETYRAHRDSYKLDLKLGPNQIELFSFPHPPKRPSTPEAVGLRHLAFDVSDLDAVITHLNSHGIDCEPIRIDEFTNQRFTFFQDPDGLPLELYER